MVVQFYLSFICFILPFYMKYKNVYINFCYLVHPNGLTDYAYVSTFNSFVGVPFNSTLFFFNDNLNIHRNLLTFVTKQQNKLFI